MRAGALAILLLSLTAQSRAMDKGPAFFVEQDLRPGRETLCLEFMGGAATAGPDKRAAAPLLRALLDQALDASRPRLTHLAALWSLDADARALTLKVAAPLESVHEALDLVVDAVRTLPIDEAQVQAARETLGRELAEQDPDRELAEAARRDIAEDAPDSLDLGLRRTDLRSPGPEALRALAATLFDPADAKAGASGPADAAQAQAWLGEALERFGKPSERFPGVRGPAPARRPRGTALRILPRPAAEAVRFFLLVPQAPARTAPQRAVQALALRDLGDAEGGRLVQELGKRRGWVTEIRCFQGPADWGIQGQVQARWFGPFLKALPGLVAALSESAPSALELEQQKLGLDLDDRLRDAQAWQRVDRALWNQRWLEHPDADEETRLALPAVTLDAVLEYARGLSLANGYLCLEGLPAELRSSVRRVDWDGTEDRLLADPLENPRDAAP